MNSTALKLALFVGMHLLYGALVVSLYNDHTSRFVLLWLLPPLVAFGLGVWILYHTFPAEWDWAARWSASVGTAILCSGVTFNVAIALAGFVHGA
jgi:hypothetical protein